MSSLLVIGLAGGRRRRVGEQTEHLANHAELHAVRLPRKP